MSRLRERRQAKKIAKQERQSAGIQQQYGQMTDAYSKVLSPKSSEEPPKPKSTNIISDFMKNQQSAHVTAQEISENEAYEKQEGKVIDWRNKRDQLNTETTRVMDARERLGNLAEKAARENASASSLGLSDKQISQFDKEGYSCSTYACQLMANANLTTSKFGNPVNTGFVNKEGKWGDKLNPGEKMRILPENKRFDANMKDLGWEMQPEGTVPNQKGDLLRGSYYDKGERFWHGTDHAGISAGEKEGGDANIVYNTGYIEQGVKYGDDYYTDKESYNTDKNSGSKYGGEGHGVARYVGDMREYEKQFQNLGGKENAPALPTFKAKTRGPAEIKSESRAKLSTLPKPTEEEMLSALSVGQKNSKRYAKKLKRQANKFTL
jgi:hypothetical protein